jgi:hypothetical protein
VSAPPKKLSFIDFYLGLPALLNTILHAAMKIEEKKHFSVTIDERQQFTIFFVMNSHHVGGERRICSIFGRLVVNLC